MGRTRVRNTSPAGTAWNSLVMRHRAYYDRSFHRRGVLGAIEYFSRSAENERELVRQVRILDAGQDPGRASDEAQPADGGTSPAREPGDRPQRGRILPGLRQPIHHVQRRGTVPGLHRPPAAGERGLMSAQKDNLEHIRKYIQTARTLFRGPGLPAPGRAPAVLHGAAARGVAAGPGQGRKTEAGGAGAGQGRVPERPDGFLRNVGGGEKPARQHQVPGRSGPHTRADSRSAQTHRGRRAQCAGHGPPRLQPGGGSASAHTPEINAYRNGFARRSW